MIKLCIFDLDGTVLDTLPAIAYHGNKALVQNNLPSIPIKEYKFLAGDGMKTLIKRMLDYNRISDNGIYDKVLNDYNNSYNSDFTKETRIFDGLKEILDKLKNNGVKIAIVSNKPHFATCSVIEHFFGRDYFDFCYGQRENIPIKPNPCTVNEIIKLSNIKKEETIYIGDTSTDMQTGKNANVYTVGVLWGFRDENELKENGADIIIHKPEQLKEIVFKI